MNAAADLLTLARRPRRQPKLEPNRAIGYVRSSKDKGDGQLGPRAQRAAIERWCRDHDVDLVRMFHDAGVSGGSDLEDRPQLLAALDALRAEGCGVLVVARRDRLSREHTVLVQRLVERRGAVVRSTDGVGNVGSPEDQLMAGVVDSFASYERALLRARTKAALAVRKASGLRTGNLPWGFKLADDGRRLLPDEGERRVLTLIRRLRRRLSFRELAVELERRGVANRSGRCGWSVGQIQRLLQASKT
ncbi:MAG TPA: recombinase family protein [Planctomycetota bacterium]|nr:recombinase family protein [Planctomycetota bacterium]